MARLPDSVAAFSCGLKRTSLKLLNEGARRFGLRPLGE